MKARQTNAFLEAIRKGNLEKVKIFMKNGISVHDRDMYDNTPLREAARYGHTNIVRWLLDNGAKINEQPIKAPRKLAVVDDVADYTALMLAAREGHEEVVRILLEKGADVTCSTWRSTALTLAVSKGHIEIFQLLAAQPLSLKEPSLNGIFYIVYKELQYLVNKVSRENKIENTEKLRKNYIDIIAFLVSKNLKASLIDKSFLIILLKDISCWLKHSGFLLSPILEQGFELNLKSPFSLNLSELSNLISVLDLFCQYLKISKKVLTYKFEELFFEEESCYIDIIPKRFKPISPDFDSSPVIEFYFTKMVNYLNMLKKIESQYKDSLTTIFPKELAGIIGSYMGLSSSVFYKSSAKKNIIIEEDNKPGKNLPKI